MSRSTYSQGNAFGLGKYYEELQLIENSIQAKSKVHAHKFKKEYDPLHKNSKQLKIIKQYPSRSAAFPPKQISRKFQAQSRSSFNLQTPIRRHYAASDSLPLKYLEQLDESAINVKDNSACTQEQIGNKIVLEVHNFGSECMDETIIKMSSPILEKRKDQVIDNREQNAAEEQLLQILEQRNEVYKIATQYFSAKGENESDLCRALTKLMRKSELYERLIAKVDRRLRKK